VVQLLAPRPGETLVDATVGGAGHSRRIAPFLAPGGRIVALDRDPVALAEARRALAGCGVVTTIVHARFSDIARAVTEQNLMYCDMLLADLGVSSPQIDDPLRGFSFSADGPLDMRMDPGAGVSAATLVEQLSVSELAHCIKEYGEEHHARAIARTIKSASPLPSTTRQLAQLVERAVPRREWGRLHPATRTFQALRIAVNDELGQLDQLLAAIPKLLASGGRAAIISFHSLEDRRVKQVFKRMVTGCICPPKLPVCSCGRTQQYALLSKRAVRPSDTEIADNPRARSAKLRAIVRRSEFEISH